MLENEFNFYSSLELPEKHSSNKKLLNELKGQLKALLLSIDVNNKRHTTFPGWMEKISNLEYEIVCCIVNTSHSILEQNDIVRI